MLKVAVFDTKQYDIPGLLKYGEENELSLRKWRKRGHQGGDTSMGPVSS